MSTRRAFLGAAAVTAAAAAAPLWLRDRSVARAPVKPTRLTLISGHGARGAQGEPSWLLANALPSSLLIHLVEDLEAALTRAQARRSPLLVDLTADDDDLGALSRRMAPWLLPAWVAALHAARDHWSVTGTPWTVTTQPSTGVSAVTQAPPEGLSRRASIAAWTVTRGLRVRAHGASEAREAARALRAAALTADSSIALVIGAGDDSTPALRSRLLRLGEEGAPTSELPEGWRELVEGFRRPPRLGRPMWMKLRPLELHVLPRMGTLATPARALDEVVAVLRGLDTSVGLAYPMIEVRQAAR